MCACRNSAISATVQLFKGEIAATVLLLDRSDEVDDVQGLKPQVLDNRRIGVHGVGQTGVPVGGQFAQ
jgi:hypothetical protein